MAGTKAGGLKVKAFHLANDPQWYQKIGAKGGSRKVPKGFAINKELAAIAGRKGGLISRRTK